MPFLPPTFASGGLWALWLASRLSVTTPAPRVAQADILLSRVRYPTQISPSGILLAIAASVNVMTAVDPLVLQQHPLPGWNAVPLPPWSVWNRLTKFWDNLFVACEQRYGDPSGRGCIGVSAAWTGPTTPRSASSGSVGAALGAQPGRRQRQLLGRA